MRRNLFGWLVVGALGMLVAGMVLGEVIRRVEWPAKEEAPAVEVPVVVESAEEEEVSEEARRVEAERALEELREAIRRRTEQEREKLRRLREEACALRAKTRIIEYELWKYGATEAQYKFLYEQCLAEYEDIGKQ